VRRSRDAARQIDQEAEHQLATEVTKPALACVTSTPALLAAATSTLRMSIAQRRKATSFGRRSNSAPGRAIGGRRR
jgi:hypothetical protein